jgi:DegV family protein with EDD domain
MVRIITDSTSDITQEDARRLNVTVVPLTVFFGSDSYRDGIDLTKKEFFERLAVSETLPTTSQVSPGEFTQLFQSCIDAGDEVVGIFISSLMSGTFQSSEVARELVDSDRIHVIDSQSATFELGLLVFEAVRLRDAGMGAAGIAENISALVGRVRLLAVIDTLKYLRMSGRISTTTAFVGGLLGINPLIAITGGRVVSIGKSRGLTAGLRQIADRMAQDPPDTGHAVTFGHINAPAFLRETVEYLSGQFNITDYIEMDIGITVGTHVGPGAAGIAYIARV